MLLPPVPRFLIRWLLRIAMLAIFVGLPAALIYVDRVGIGFGLKEQIEKALRGDNFKTSIGKLRFNPFRGLVAEDVVVSGTTPDGPDFAHIDRLTISVSMSDYLMNRQVTVDHLELDGTDVSVPIEPGPNPVRVELRNVNGQFVLVADQMRLSYFDCELFGIRISLNGLVRNPGAFHFGNATANTSGQAHRELVADIIDSLSKLRFSGSRPEIRLEISGDLADTSTIRIAPISIQSGPIIGPTWRIEGVQAQATVANKILTIPQLQIQGTDGSLNLSGRLEDGQFEFELASSMSPKPLMGLFPKTSFARNLVFQEAPQLTVSGTVDVKNPSASFLTGSVRAGKFTVKGAKVDTLAADFAWRDGQVFARDVQLWMNGAELIADVLYSPTEFRLRMTNSIPPTLFAPLLGPKEQEFLKQMEFKDNPYVQIEVQGAKPDFASVTGTGTMKLGRTAMRGAWFDSAEAKLEIANRAVSYKDFTIKGRGGTGTGMFVYDFGGQQVRLQNINSSLFPVDVLMWADPKIAEALKPYRFTKAPKVQGGGVISLKDPSGNNLALKLQADGFDYDLLARTLHFGRTSGTVNVVGSKVLVKIGSAKLMDGEAALDADVSTSPSDPTVKANVTVKRVDFAKLTKLYFGYDSSQGVASGTYKFTMRGGLAETMKGEGNLRVEDGKVFAIPFLGPFSDILDKIIPGSGYESAHLATADFRISDGKIFTDNLVIQGFGFNLIGSGDIGFLVDRMNLSVRINAKGVPGIVLFPVSKLFEYVSTGSFADPQWRPKIIPRFDSGNNADATKEPEASGTHPAPQKANGGDRSTGRQR